MPDLPEKDRGVFSEKHPIVEVGEIPSTEAEQEGLIERTGEIQLTQPVTHQGQTLVTSLVAQRPQIVLPIARATYVNPKNWHRPVSSAMRWLLEWAKRIIKMNPEATTFR